MNANDYIKIPSKNRNIILWLTLVTIIVILLLLLLVAFLYFRTTLLQRYKQIINAPLSYVRGLAKPPGVIIKAVTAKSFNKESGEEEQVQNKFNQNDQNITLVIHVKNNKPGTKISYTRYINNRYLDNKSFTINKEDTKFVNFDWSLKDRSKRAKGEYKVRLYTNDIYETTIYYSVE